MYWGNELAKRLLQKINCGNSIAERLSCGMNKVAKASLQKAVLWKYSLRDRSCGIKITEVTKEIFGHIAKFGSSGYEFKILAVDG